VGREIKGERVHARVYRHVCVDRCVFVWAWGVLAGGAGMVDDLTKMMDAAEAKVRVCQLVGCWLLVVGCWLLVVGCWLLVVGCWLLVVG
jgi:hypothetical protein